MADSVYNSTTVSYENPGPGSPNLRPWNLSEMVAPPVPRKTWFHWGLLWLGILGVGFGTPVCIFEFFRYATTDDSNHHSLIAALLAFVMAVIGSSLLLFYYKLTTNPSFCLRVANTRNAFRKVITKPRFQNAQARSGATLLTNEPNSFQPTLSTQYDPVPDIGFDQNNGDTSEERAKLMMHEAKDGTDDITVSSCERLVTSDSTGTSSSNSVSKDPRIVLHPFAKA